ncbi:hypothetical protein BDR26DRAFT_994967 [Obelidium mucronatum]|nr:hypothetical protein BDR26DRAFT_994967 [Obelidium mucronatum]
MTLPKNNKEDKADNAVNNYQSLEKLFKAGQFSVCGIKNMCKVFINTFCASAVNDFAAFEPALSFPSLAKKLLLTGKTSWVTLNVVKTLLQLSRKTILRNLLQKSASLITVTTFISIPHLSKERTHLPDCKVWDGKESREDHFKLTQTVLPIPIVLGPTRRGKEALMQKGPNLNVLRNRWNHAGTNDSSNMEVDTHQNDGNLDAPMTIDVSTSKICSLQDGMTVADSSAKSLIYVMLPIGAYRFALNKIHVSDVVSDNLILLYRLLSMNGDYMLMNKDSMCAIHGKSSQSSISKLALFQDHDVRNEEDSFLTPSKALLATADKWVEELKTAVGKYVACEYHSNGGLEVSEKAPTYQHDDHDLQSQTLPPSLHPP